MTGLPQNSIVRTVTKLKGKQTHLNWFQVQKTPRFYKMSRICFSSIKPFHSHQLITRCPSYLWVKQWQKWKSLAIHFYIHWMKQQLIDTVLLNENMKVACAGHCVDSPGKRRWKWRLETLQKAGPLLAPHKSGFICTLVGILQERNASSFHKLLSSRQFQQLPRDSE